MGRRTAAILVLVPWLWVPAASAASHYVRAGATGNGGGSDWTDACADFTGSCANPVRGDTYYVASGNYAARTFSTPVSGTAVITIKAATAADHGTAAGWQGTYAVGTVPATFAYPVVVNSDYWVFDGQVGAGNALSSYGFNVAKPASCNSGPQSYWWIEDKSNITERYIGIDACGSAFDVQQVCFDVGQGSGRLIEHNFANHCQNSIKLWNASNDTLQYNQLWNQWSSPSHHGESVNNFSTDQITFRYNYLDGCAGTACIACNVGNAIAMNHWSIYGNVFKDDASGNGTVAATQQVIANSLVYDNTFDNITSGAWFLDADPGFGGQATGNVLKNNLLYNSIANIGNNGAPIDHDYNSFFSSRNGVPAEAHGQTGTGSPFVNGSGGDYHLAGGATVNPGLGLAAPYNLDPDGNTRGSDGAWDRGAYEYASGGGDTTPPAVVVSSPANGSTVSGNVTLSANASDNAGVVFVQFLVDGVSIGSPVTAPPYSIAWNAQNQPNNSRHTIAAVATDAAGNAMTSASVVVTVSKRLNPNADVPGLRDAFAYPNPAIRQAPAIRAMLGRVDSVDVTVFDMAEQVVNSGSLGGSPSGITADGEYYYDYVWSGAQASGVYVAVIRGKKSDGTNVRARVKFAVVR